MASSLDINPEPASTTCTKSSETFLSMEPSVSFIKKWPETTELTRTLFPSSEPQSFIEKTKSEDPRATFTETASSGSPFSDPSQEPATRDIEPSSRPTDPTPSNSDVQYLNSIYHQSISLPKLS